MPKASQWDPIGEEAADKMRDQAKDLGFTREKFRYFIHQAYPELIGAFDHAEGLHDLSLAFKTPYEEFLRELRGSTDRKPEQSQHADPSPEPNFSPTPQAQAANGADEDFDITF